jgi:integrase/recombinase XerD
MLEGGADVRYIQQMLGHSRLENTDVYTDVSIRTLKAVHSVTHSARLQRTTTEPKLPSAGFGVRRSGSQQ